MRRILVRSAAALALALLAACTQKNTADQQDQAGAAAADVALGVNRFLLFPNPIGTDPLAVNGGTFETDTIVYAQAYYDAIDPPDINNNRTRDTLDKWKAQNGFSDSSNPLAGTEKLAVFRDVKDLGYGRRMTGRRNTSGSIAFYVENYNVAPNGSGGYSSDLNVDAAILRSSQWHVGTNAIEWSSTPCRPNYDPTDCDNTGTVRFAKYFNFSAVDGTRQLQVDLDGHGLKAMPGPCITCHGGRGDPLTPNDATGNPRFPLVENSPSRKRGDVEGRLPPMNVDSFSYSTDQPGFAKSDMQGPLRFFNQWILCTYPTPTPASVTDSSGATCNRPTAGFNEWQGTAAEMLQYWYGNDPNLMGAFADTYVPTGWGGVGGIAGPGTAILNTAPLITDVALYQNVVAPFCRTCHILRGTANQSDLDFTSLAKFQSAVDRIKVHVFDRGNMPLAQIPHSDFWNSSAPQTLANFVDSQLGVGTATSSGVPLMPGRPIADAGPNRMVRTGTDASLSGANSLFTSTYSWTYVGGGQAPLITNANQMNATFNASAAGTYPVRLTVDGGAFQDIVITVDDNFPDPSKIKFAHVKNVLQNLVHATGNKCVLCHKNVSPPLPGTTPPIWYTDFDRDGNGAVDPTDNSWFVSELSGRVNLTDIQASPLLRKPTGKHHNGGTLLNLADTSSGGGLSNYSILYNWILDGMPSGGVAANPGPNTISPPLTLTFNGVFPGPFTATIPLDGTQSVGEGLPLTYLWTIASQPTGGAAVFPGNAFTSTAATTSLTIQQPGTYQAQLQLSDGPSTDVAQRTIVVAETPLAFNVNVAGLSAGNVSVSFAGTPAAGTIGVTATQTTGNPVTCLWQVNGAAPTPSATGVSVGPSSCASATLNVQPSAVGSTFSVSLTEQNLSLPPVVISQTFAVLAAAGSNPTGASFSATSSTALGWTINNVPGSTPTKTISSVTLQGSASGPGPLNFSWTTTGTGCSIPAGASTSTTRVLSIAQVGTCSVTMTVSNGFPPNAVVTLPVTITSTVAFSQVAAILGNGGTASPGTNASCTGCHFAGSTITPSWETNGSVAQNNALRTALSGVITGTSQSSLLLVCPSVGCTIGTQTMPSPQTGFGSGVFNNYDAFLTWIINGQP